MTLENVYVIPHGDEIIERPNQQSSHLFELIEDIGKKDRSESIIVLSPHGLRLSNSIGVINTEFLRADLTLKNCRIRKNYRTDRTLASDIVNGDEIAQEVSFITSSGPKSSFPLDFGSVIPLYFFGKKEVVSIGQPRIWDKGRLLNFGHTIAALASKSEKTVSIIISADQAHTHAATGPYGFANESSSYENLVEKAIAESNLDLLVPLGRDFIDKAKPDSYWNMLILKGIMDETGLKSILDYHYVEHYFGMLLAHLE